MQRLTDQQWPRSLREDWSVWLLQRNLDTHACSALHLRVYKYNASTLEGHTRRAHWKGTLTGHTQRAHLEGHGHMCRSLNMPSGPGNEVNRYNIKKSCQEKQGKEKLFLSIQAVCGCRCMRRTCPPGQQDTRISPVANAGDRFSTCIIWFQM